MMVMRMIVNRVLHPVGHGAFFTEQFYDCQTGENVMNVVYDCGVRSNQPLLEQEIDGAFARSNRPHVDFLFISHLDKDHVSGIKYMIAAKYIDDMTTFVLPLYKDYELRIYEELTGNGVLAIYEVLRLAGVRRVLYVPLSGGERINGDDLSPIDMEGAFEDIEGDEVKVNELRGKLIKPTEKFIFRQIWEYIPFNLHDSTSVDFFDRVAKHPDLNIQDLDDVKRIFENSCSPNVKNKTPEQIDANKKLKALKSIYNSIGTLVGHDTLININSLAVVSQAVGHIFIKASLLERERFYWFWYDRKYYETIESDGNGTCTYTGDLNLSQDKDFDLLEQKVVSVLRSAPVFQMLQIPHHGSKTSYNKRFCGGLSGCCFVNFNSGNGIFDQSITYDFFCARKQLLPVTEIASSRVVQEMMLR